MSANRPSFFFKAIRHPPSLARLHSVIRSKPQLDNMISETSPRRLARSTNGEESTNTTSLSSTPQRSNENGDAVTPARGERQVKSTDGRVFIVRCVSVLFQYPI